MPIQNLPPTDVSGVNRATPTAAYGAGAGTSPPGSPTVTGDDARGNVTFGTGTVPGTGVAITITFVQPRDNNRPPIVIAQESTAAMAGIDFATIPVVAGGQVTGFQIVTAVRGLAASQANGTYGVGWILAE